MTKTPMTERPMSGLSRTERHLSPSARRSPGLLPLIFEQTRAEFLQNLRVPEFLVGIVAIPVILFMMFGLPSADNTLPGGTRVGTLMMASFGAYGILSLAIFTFGVDVASERGRGWLTLMRATPLPAWVYFAAKLAMVAFFGMLTLLVLFGTGYLLAGVRLSLGNWLTAFGVLLAGALSFSTLGFTLGYLARPKSASTIANLVYLPLSFASGFFFPLAELPQVVLSRVQFLVRGGLPHRALRTAYDLLGELSRRQVPQGRVWAKLVVLDPPSFDLLTGISKTQKPVSIETLVPE